MIWRSTLLLTILVSAIALPLPASPDAARKTKVAVIQADGSPKQDPFKAGFDLSKVRPQSQAHLDKLLGLFEKAGEMGADIVCGPEDMQNIGAYGLHVDVTDPASGEILFNSLAVPVPGPLTDRIAEIARRYHMYVIAPLYEKEGGRIFNSAVVFDREGRIIGKHHKTVLPILETWLVDPGDTYDVFETDFAKIAVATCWEITFPEVMRLYGLGGADIIFHPTMGRENKSGQSLATAYRYLTRATDERVYLAPVILGSDGNGIIDPRGKVVAEAVGEHNVVIMAEIDFAEQFLSDSRWWNTINGSDDDKAIHFLSRRVQTFGLLLDPHPPVLERYRDVRLTTDDRQRQLESVRQVNYGP
ncbi:MAG: carbon-nitrogen hydrolase family protein [Candidatus Glassbacteria bacterium]